MGPFLLALSWPFPPPGPCFGWFLAVLSLLSVWLLLSWFPFLLWLLLVFFGLWVFCLRFLRLSSSCLCVLLFVLWGVPPFFWCLWVVLSFAGFSVLWCGGSPPSFVPPSPLSVVPLTRPGPVLCWSLPLGIWLLHATARLPCFNAWGVVVLCFLASFCSMAAKAIWPCVGICVPSTPWRICCCGALCSYTEVFIFG